MAPSAVPVTAAGRLTTQITPAAAQERPGTAWTLLVRGARQALDPTPTGRTETLVLGIWAALAANQLDRSMEETAGNSRLPGQDDVSGQAGR